MEITKYVLPVVVGAMSGMTLIMIGQTYGVYHMYFPNADYYDADSVANGMRLMPDSAFRMLLLIYIAASFFAGIIATLIAKRNTSLPAMVVGIVLTLAGLYNAVNLPHPLWFTIINMVSYIPAAWLAYLLVRKRPVQQTP